MVPAYARPTVFVGATRFLLLDELRPLSVAPLCARLLRGGFLVVLAVDESLWLSLALSNVLPCNMFWLHVSLHSTGSGPSVVLGALP